MEAATVIAGAPAMPCPACHHENADDARFCGECGAGLAREVACSGCGRSNPAGQKFCNGCGGRLGAPAASDAPAPDRRPPTAQHLAEKIRRSKATLEGERKQVTVLFADIVSSTELAARIGDRRPRTGA